MIPREMVIDNFVTGATSFLRSSVWDTNRVRVCVCLTPDTDIVRQCVSLTSDKDGHIFWQRYQLPKMADGHN